MGFPGGQVQRGQKAAYLGKAGAETKAIATTEGRFPRWQEVIPTYGAYHTGEPGKDDPYTGGYHAAVEITVDPAILETALAAVRKVATTATAKGVRLIVPVPRVTPTGTVAIGPLKIVARNAETGVEAVGVVMPLTKDGETPKYGRQL